MLRIIDLFLQDSDQHQEQFLYTSTQQKRYPIFEASYKNRIDHINIRNTKVTRNCLDSISDSGYYQRLEYLVQHGFLDGHIFQLNKQIITLWEPCMRDQN